MKRTEPSQCSQMITCSGTSRQPHVALARFSSVAGLFPPLPQADPVGQTVDPHGGEANEKHTQHKKQHHPADQLAHTSIY